MPAGRPHKCPYCGGTDTVNKGARKTKAMGIRRIRRCRSCGRRFTPRHQKNKASDTPESIQAEPGDAAESESTNTVESQNVGASELESAESVEPTAVPSIDPGAPSDEHPRFGL